MKITPAGQREFTSGRSPNRMKTLHDNPRRVQSTIAQGEFKLATRNKLPRAVLRAMALISIDMSETTGMAPTTLHHMPCAIKCDGYAGVSTYFQSTVEQKGEDKLEARFRGRLLEGRNVNLPQDVQGFVFREKAPAGAGPPNASTEFPFYHRIDYVHVAQPA